MSVSQNEVIAGRWFEQLWGSHFNVSAIDMLASPAIRFESALYRSYCRGRRELRKFAGEVRTEFPDLSFRSTTDLITEGEYVIVHWEGGGTQTASPSGPSSVGFPFLDGKSIQFAGVTVLRIENARITEEVGLEDGISVSENRFSAVPSFGETSVTGIRSAHTWQGHSAIRV